MIDPLLVQFLSSIVSGAIAGVISDLVTARLQKRSSHRTRRGKYFPNLRYPAPQKPIANTPARFLSSRKFRWGITAIAFIIGGSFGYYVIGQRLQAQPFTLPDITTDGTPNATLSAPPTPGSSPTPVARGKLIMEVNFANIGEGDCDNYNANLLGYEDRQYYILPADNGYIAICGNGTRPPLGSLQVTAYPSTLSSTFGYGVLFGWSGSGLSTKDACIFGIRQIAATATDHNGAPSTRTSVEAVFSQFNNGDYTHDRRILDLTTLDNNPHTIRMVLRPDGFVAGYLDERFVAEHQYTDCKQGPIGLAAWGDGETKIYFDDLKLYDLQQ